MRGHALMDWMQNIRPNVTYLGLKSFERVIEERPECLVKGTFGDGDDGCVIQHLARLHPLFRDEESPGKTFVATYRCIWLIADWDANKVNRKQLLLLVRAEMFARRQARAARKAAVTCC